MAEETEKPRGVGRREFIAGTGVFLTGAVSTIVSCAASSAEDAQGPVCRTLLHDPERCVGCGTCVMMCSLYREGEVGPTLSRSEIVRDPFSYDFTFVVCQQCGYPACYFACPLQDRARRVDSVTGIVYVDDGECIGCGRCVSACRFEPPRTTVHQEKWVAFNCDRCRERIDGPICIECCPMNALSCSNMRQPRRPRGRRGYSTPQKLQVEG